METAHLFLELRFAAPSFPFLDRGMTLAGALAEVMPSYESDGTAVKFNPANDDHVGIEPTRIALDLHGPGATPQRCIELATTVCKGWQEHIGDLPKYQRLGFRAQLYEPAQLERRELIEVETRHIFSEGYQKKFGEADFALTVEDVDGLTGYRVFAGAMHHEEMLAKWPPRFTVEHDARSYLTLDLDHGTTHVQGFGFDAFVLEKWAEMNKTFAWFVAPLT